MITSKKDPNVYKITFDAEKHKKWEGKGKDPGRKAFLQVVEEKILGNTWSRPFWEGQSQEGFPSGRGGEYLI